MKSHSLKRRNYGSRTREEEEKVHVSAPWHPDNGSCMFEKSGMAICLYVHENVLIDLPVFI